MRESFPCPVCDHRTRETLFAVRDRLHGIPGTWNLLRCAGCGLLHLDPLPTQDEIPGFYPASYYAHHVGERGFHARKNSRRLRWYLHGCLGYPDSRGGKDRPGAWKRAFGALCGLVTGKKDLEPWRGQGRLLEVGCGVGGYLFRQRALGWRVTGVELDDQAARIGRSQGLDIRSGPLDAHSLSTASFDLVRLSHVLEHVPDPLGFLREVARVLAPGGVVKLSLPNAASAGLAEFGADWFPLEAPRHLFHFGPRQLEMLAGRVGLRMTRWECRSGVGFRLLSLAYRAEGPVGPRRRESFAAPKGAVRRRLARQVAQEDAQGRGDIFAATLQA